MRRRLSAGDGPFPFKRHQREPVRTLEFDAPVRGRQHAEPIFHRAAQYSGSSDGKIRYDTTAQSVISKTKMVEGPNRNFEIFDPLDFLAAVTCHIPNRGEHLVRYYGYYSSVQRGRRRRQGREKMPLGPAPLSDDTPTARSMRANWARYIKKVFAADPLICPDCGGAMRIVAFIEDQCVVRAILVHLSLWDEARPPPVTPGAAPHASTELEYLPWVE